jgi:hypothetical protein
MNRLTTLLMVVALLFCVPGALVPASADTTVVSPKGEYAQIDTRLASEAMAIFAKGTPAEKQAMAASIQATPENYAPPVYYAFSEALFQAGRKDEAAFWFYAGQLRARFDANRCADASARQAVGALNRRFGSPINKYMFQDISKLEQMIPTVIEWDRRTVHNYDHRWINLHGMGAIISGLAEKAPASPPKALSLPKERWEAIAEETRVAYLVNFEKALQRIKNKAN